MKERKSFQEFLSSVNSQTVFEKEILSGLIKKGITLEVFQDCLSLNRRSDIASIFFEDESILSCLFSNRSAADFACRFFDG